MPYLNRALKARLLEEGLKICTKCSETKPLDNFYNNKARHDGKTDWCKDCTRAYQSTPSAKKAQDKYRESEKWDEWQRQYWQTDTYKQSQRGYRKSAKGRLVQDRHETKYRKANPEKRRAKDAVYYAVRTGKLPHASTLKCECGEQAECYHHWSYLPEHKLDVVPLCHACHIAIHSDPTD